MCSNFPHPPPSGCCTHVNRQYENPYRSRSGLLNLLNIWADQILLQLERQSYPQKKKGKRKDEAGTIALLATTLLLSHRSAGSRMGSS
jgi:hypothetical protein